MKVSLSQYSRNKLTTKCGQEGLYLSQYPSKKLVTKCGWDQDSKKKRQDSGIKNKIEAGSGGGGDLRTPIVDPLLCFHIRKFFFWINNTCL